MPQHDDSLPVDELRFDAFMEVQGLGGESTDSNHKEWIELIGISWGVHQPSDAAPGDHERADFDDMRVLKVMDKSSTGLFAYCAMGKLVKEIKIELCEATGEQDRIGHFTLHDCMISGLRILNAVTKQGPPRPLEEVTMRYSKITFIYRSHSQDGKRASDGHFLWDLKENAPE